jgi:hypothetical protein
MQQWWAVLGDRTSGPCRVKRSRPAVAPDYSQNPPFRLRVGTNPFWKPRTLASSHTVFEIQSASSRFADEKLKRDDCCCKSPVATLCVQSAFPDD